MKFPKLTWHIVFASLAASAILITPESGSAANCGKKVTNSGKTIQWTGDAAMFKSSVLNVDADGAPNSYRVDGKGLSYTCDGVNAVGSSPKTDKHHWQEKCNAAWAKAVLTGDYSGVRIFGFLTGAKNVPEKQKTGDPLPDEAFITTTAVSIPNTPDGTQRHWVDAVEIPYVVLPTSFTKKFSVKDGGVAVVYRPKTGKYAFAVYADEGGLGEASVRLHQDIGSNPIVTKGGVDRAKATIDDLTLTVVFPAAITTPTTDLTKWRQEINDLGKKTLDAWGGIDRLKACSK